MFTKQFILKKLSQGVLHLLFWIVILIFFTFLFSVGRKNDSGSFYFSLFLMPVTIATTYVSIYKLIPEYLVTKRYFRFTIYSLYLLIISAYIIFFSIFYSFTYLIRFDYSDISSISRNVLFVIISVYLVTIIVSAFKILKINLKNTTKTSKLETKILETQLKLKENELNYLKMQIHPHFLFNTLNTMYGFALKKADETPEMILKLSNLLDYLLYQIDKPFVDLNDEVNHIKDYIALEQLRFNDRLKVNLVEDHQSKHNKITPMLFLPFVENSFKHGQIENEKLEIDIIILSAINSIHFNIKNKARALETSNQGIGLDNIKKRLELLYKDHYQLEITTKNNMFEVNLILNTTKHV